jgi:fused signal recognition particle receptor
MADEKKPGFFKRLFGFGKGAEPAPAPEATEAAPAPEIVVEAPLIRDEAAERIAAEIAQAKRAAEENAARERAEADAAERVQLAREEAARTAEAAETQRRAALKAAADKAAEERAAQEKTDREKIDREKIDRESAAREKAAADQAEAARKAEVAREAEAEQAQAAAREAAKLEAQRLAVEQAREAAEAARRAEELRLAEERQLAEKLAADKLAAEKLAADEKLAAEKLAAERAAAAQAEAERLESARIAAAAAAEAAISAAPAPKLSWWQKLKSGLSRTAGNVTEGITSLFTKRKLDDATLEELEDLLIQADLGVDVAARISAAVGKGRYDKEIEPDEVKAILADEVSRVLKPVAQPLVVQPQKPFVLLMVGVNGSGKTTTIGKLASKFRAEGKTVMLAAGDTFRAAAIEQLRVWGQRTGAPVVARDQGGDAAGLAFDAVKAAQEQGTDVLLIDTAGRLQNRTELMAELEKVIRVIRKLDATAPHATLLVLDATVGQNAISQVDIFGKQAGVTGLVMTKLDGTARGGILVALAEKFKLPIHFIGVGEGVDDLEPFEATDFARAIAGLERLA